MDNNLKPTHLQFVLKYLETNNIQASYKYAYPNSSDSTAHVNGQKLIKRVDIKQYIDEYKAKLEEENRLTIDKVVKRLDDIATAYATSTNNKLKANELILRTLGAFRDKVEVTSNNTTTVTTVDYSQLSDEELKKIVEGDVSE